MTLWDKLLEVIQKPSYTDIRTVKIEISKEELLELVREGKVRISKNGHVEVADQPDKLKNIIAEARVITEEKE